MSRTTLYWHDYETSGRDARCDRPMQFAGIRTDEQLNIIGDPLTLYCKLSRDVLPHPEACLLTGITPQLCEERGVIEPEFVRRIHAELSQAGTCGVGYNSIRFDDEFTRHALYRNFYDPYEREWRNGNARWDIIDMLRLCRALRPEGIEWPDNAEGRPSFRLEDLTAANGIQHVGAHDALVDVQATLALARLVKARQPKLYDWCYGLRDKKRVLELLDLNSKRPLLHTSGKLSAQHAYTTLVMPLVQHPTNKNAIICVDLMDDPAPLLMLSVEEIRQRVFTRRDDLPAGVERISLKAIHANKSPSIAPLSLLDAATEQRLQLNRKRCEQHWQQLLSSSDIALKLQTVFAQDYESTISDVEQQLYAGFFNDVDKQAMLAVRRADVPALTTRTFSFADKRLPEMLFRYRARNFPEALSAAEQAQWEEYRWQRLTSPRGGGNITLDEYRATLATLRTGDTISAAQHQVLDALTEWGHTLESAGENG